MSTPRTSPGHSFLGVAVNELRALQRNLKGHSDQLHLGDLLQLAQGLWLISKLANEGIEPCKVRLRQLALQEAKGQPGVVQLEAAGVRCTVNIPSPTWELQPTANLARLKELLGPRFLELFEEIPVTYRTRKDFAKQLAACPPEQKREVLSELIMQDGKPRVYFSD